MSRVILVDVVGWEDNPRQLIVGEDGEILLQLDKGDTFKAGLTPYLTQVQEVLKGKGFWYEGSTTRDDSVFVVLGRQSFQLGPTYWAGSILDLKIFEHVS